MSDITTPGAVLLKHMMPTKEAQDSFDLYTPIDKSQMTKLISNLVRHGGSKAPDVIQKLANLFFNTATAQGSSTPLSDYYNDDDERQAILTEIAHKVEQILGSKKPQAEKEKELAIFIGEGQQKLIKQNIKYMLAKKSVAAKMAHTGARGNPGQFASATGSPLVAEDISGKIIPVVVKHSFAEGLSPAEFLAMSYKGRANTVASQLSTALPGEIFKELTPNLYHEVVTTHDCGTKNGILLPISDRKSIEGRFEAGTNKEITSSYYKELHDSKRTTVKVRSPQTCEAKDGICQLCYGIAANGHLPEIGFNAGVVASQSVSEVLTQGVLSTKHGTKVGGIQRSMYDLANNLLTNPPSFLDEATVASTRGKVKSIRTTPLKDHIVNINDIEHYVPKAQDPIVKVGDFVRHGDVISTGVANPRDIAKYKGLGAARNHLSTELRKVYGSGLDPRHFDLIAKNLVKFNEVVDPGDTDFLHGEKVSLERMEPYLASVSKEVPLDQAKDRMLGKKLLDYTPGTVLNQNHIEDLHAAGVKTVPVANTNLKLAPLVPGLKTAKLLDPNWISRLGFNNLGKSIKDAAAEGHVSYVHSTEPIAPYMMGSEFGKGKNGAY